MWTVPDPKPMLPRPADVPERIDTFCEEWIKTNDAQKALMVALRDWLCADNMIVFAGEAYYWRTDPAVLLRKHQIEREIEESPERIVSKAELIAMLRDVALGVHPPNALGVQRYKYNEAARMKAADQLAAMMDMKPQNDRRLNIQQNNFGDGRGGVVVVPAGLTPEQLEARTVYVDVDDKS